MNQEKLKEVLLSVKSDVKDFTVVFSGKASRKVDGLYHPDKMEIIIHNKNFMDDNSVIYVGLHEMAHHIQFTEHEGQHTGRAAHSSLFWHIFHDLLKRAEEKKIYKNIFISDHRFAELTSDIKKKFLQKNGALMKDFGKHLVQALDLCQQTHANYEDYIDRGLGMGRNSAKQLMKVYAMDIDSDIGFENMKIVSGIKDASKRKELEEEFKAGSSQEQVKHKIKTEKPERSNFSIKRLEAQRKRVEKAIFEMQSKLADLDDQIQKAREEEGV